MKCIEDEIPFDVPDGWAWCRLQTICPYGDCEKVETKDIKPDEWILDLEDIEKDTGNIISVILKKDRNSVSTKHKFYKGQLLYSKLRPYLNKVVIAINDGYCTSEILPLKLFGSINPSYMQIYLMSEVFLSYVNMISYGVKMPRLGTEDGRKALIALPPLMEQYRIVEAFNNIKSIIKSIEANSIELKDIVGLIKSQILDLAIRGKLVPQNPDDEPASLLLERIRAEKEELIKQGKIKRDKKESVIFKGEDNSYYQDLPLNWSISSLSEITTPLLLNDGDWILSDNMVPFGDIKLIQLGSVGFLKYADKGFKYLTSEMFTELNCTEIHSGYMLINRIVSDKMCACVLPEIEGKKITTVDTCWIAPEDEWFNLKYILFAISSPIYQSLVMLNSSGTTRKRISKSNLISLPLALPPLAERRRTIASNPC